MTDFADLTALNVNSTLKRASAGIHTQLLLDVSGAIVGRQGVKAEHVHLFSHEVPPGIYPDMTEHGWDRDDWPDLWHVGRKGKRSGTPWAAGREGCSE